eukprot:11894507-Ditylum_brightwellii.AAC.1
MMKQCLAFRRTLEGYEKMSKHITVMLCSRLDGAYYHPGNSNDGYGEYGVIPLYIVHSSKRKNKPGKGERTENDNDFVDRATSAFSNRLYTYDMNYDMTLQNIYGFGCNISKKGSMQQENFDYAKYFVKHFPPDQGKEE